MHFQSDSVIVFRESNTHVCSLGVPGDICQRLLKDSEQRGGTLQVQRELILWGYADITLHASSFLKCPSRPFDSSNETEIVEDAGTQLGRDTAHALYRVV